jgi:hypothetical protein
MAKNLMIRAFFLHFLAPGFRIHKIIESGSIADPNPTALVISVVMDQNNSGPFSINLLHIKATGTYTVLC